MVQQYFRQCEEYQLCPFKTYSCSAKHSDAFTLEVGRATLVKRLKAWNVKVEDLKEPKHSCDLLNKRRPLSEGYWPEEEASFTPRLLPQSETAPKYDESYSIHQQRDAVRVSHVYDETTVLHESYSQDKLMQDKADGLDLYPFHLLSEENGVSMPHAEPVSSYVNLFNGGGRSVFYDISIAAHSGWNSVRPTTALKTVQIGQGLHDSDYKGDTFVSCLVIDGETMPPMETVPACSIKHVTHAGKEGNNQTVYFYSKKDAKCVHNWHVTLNLSRSEWLRSKFDRLLGGDDCVTIVTNNRNEDMVFCTLERGTRNGRYCISHKSLQTVVNTWTMQGECSVIAI